MAMANWWNLYYYYYYKPLVVCWDMLQASKAEWACLLPAWTIPHLVHIHPSYAPEHPNYDNSNSDRDDLECE